MVVKKLSYLKIKSISLLSDKNSEQIEKVQEIAPRLSLNIITLNHALQYHLFTAFPVHTPTSFRQSRRNRGLGPLLQAFHRLAAVPHLPVRADHGQGLPAGNLRRSADQPVTALSSVHGASRQVHTYRCDEPSHPVRFQLTCSTNCLPDA